MICACNPFRPGEPGYETWLAWQRTQTTSLAREIEPIPARLATWGPHSMPKRPLPRIDALERPWLRHVERCGRAAYEK